MFICLNINNTTYGIGPTLQKAWENAQDNGVEAYEFSDCEFYEVENTIEVEQTIVPVTKVVAQKTTQPKR